MGKQEEKKEQELKLSFYSASVIVAVLIAAVTTVLTFVNTAKADYYYTLSRLGGLFDKDEPFLEDYIDFYGSYIFDEKASDNMMVYAYVAAVLTAITTILLVLVLLKVVNPEKKPAVAMTMISFFIALGALVAFCLMAKYGKDCIKEAEEMFEVYNLKEKHLFSFYDYCLVGCIANAVCGLIAVFGANFATIKYNKNNR